MTILGSLLLSALPAHASLTLCNETSYMLEASVASPTGAKWKVEGWWSLQPGDCTVAIESPLKSDDYYTFGRSISGHEGGIRAWGGRYAFCTGEGSYSLTNRPNCEEAGLTVFGFAKVETKNNQKWTNTFTEPAGYSAAKARVAGVQRLLGDIGYDRVSVDGYMGRRTKVAMAKFKKDLSLKKGEDLTPEFFDAMARKANEQVQQAGLELCNETPHDLFAAIAYEEDATGWTSRGWYHLKNGTCIKALKDQLAQEEYFVYAESEIGDGEMMVWNGERVFCTNTIRFSIDGDQNCAVRGYDQRGFVEIEPKENAHWRHAFSLNNPAVAVGGPETPETEVPETEAPETVAPETETTGTAEE